MNKIKTKSLDDHRVSICKAGHAIHAFRLLQEAHIPHIKMHGIVIPMSDIIALATNHSTSPAVRAYFGISTEYDHVEGCTACHLPTHQEAYLKLYVVPVDDSCQDIFNSSDVCAPNSIYDFTSPCPPFCDLESILYDPSNLTDLCADCDK